MHNASNHATPSARRPVHTWVALAVLALGLVLFAVPAAVGYWLLPEQDAFDALERVLQEQAHALEEGSAQLQQRESVLETARVALDRDVQGRHDAQAARGGQQTTALQRTRSRARLRTQQSARNRHQARSRRHRGRHHLHHRHHRLRLSNHPLPGQRSVVGAVVAGVVRKAVGKVARQAADQQVRHQAEAALDRRARVPRYDSS
jgi:multidrug efflux pump subunit AcrB